MSKKLISILLIIALLLNIGTIAFFYKTNTDLKATVEENQKAADKKITELSTALKSTKGDLTSANSEISSLSTELSATQEELTAANGEIAALSIALSETQTDLTSANEKIDNLTTQLESTGTELSATQEELTAANGEIATLSIALSGTQTDLTSANEKIDNLTTELESTDTELSATQEELAAANEEISTLSETVSGLNEELSATKAELAQAKDSLDETDGKLQTVLEESEAMSGVVSELYFLDGVNSLPYNPEYAESLLKKASDSGYAAASLRLGEEYMSGEYLGKDFGKAHEYLTIADEQQVSGSKLALARLYYEQAEYEKAIECLTFAADEGSVTALMELGRAYETDDYGARDMEKAIEYYTLAGKLGSQDSKAKADQAIADMNTYMSAEQKYAAKEYKAAISIFESLADKYDSPTRVKEVKYDYAGILAVTGEQDEAKRIYEEISGYKDVDTILADENYWGISARMVLGVYDQYDNWLYYYDDLVGYQQDLESGQRINMVLRLKNNTQKDISVSVTTEALSWTTYSLKAGSEKGFYSVICSYGDDSTPTSAQQIRWFVNGKEKLDGSYYIFTNGKSTQRKAAEKAVTSISVTDVRLAVYNGLSEVDGKEPFLNTLDAGEYITSVFTLTNNSTEVFEYYENELMMSIDDEGYYWSGSSFNAGESFTRRIGQSSAEEVFTEGEHKYVIYLKGVKIAEGEYEVKMQKKSLNEAEDIVVGDWIEFGHYEQDNDSANGTEPIEWIVLAVQDEVSLVLISKYALDCKPYNTSYTDITWETCTLREWLNEGFYNTAFSAEEQTKIVPVTLENENNPSYGTTGGNATLDRVWLLSINEATNSFTGEKVYSYFTNNTSRICYATAYAVAQGAYTYKGACLWWLRSPGFKSGNATCVRDYGYVNTNRAFVNNDTYGVRPVVVVLNACGSKGIVGTWKVQTMAAQGVTVNLKEMGGSMTFTFKADGKGTLTENMSGSTNTEEFTYSTANGKITITSNGESKSFDYKLSGKTLIMDMEIEEGQVVKLTMTK